jgi:FKBP-type peptidyl-prolyl cis-trans isomerase (trigger factor)
MNNTINNTVNREETALSFLEENYPYQFEVLMQYKNQINDFVKFTEMFEATVEQEKLKLDLSVISGRFKKYARNWIDNQSKYDTQVISLNPNQTNDKIGGF